MFLNSDDTQVQLHKHILRTVCTDMANLVFNSLATEHMMSTGEESEVTQEVGAHAKNFIYILKCPINLNASDIDLKMLILCIYAISSFHDTSVLMLVSFMVFYMLNVHA